MKDDRSTSDQRCVAKILRAARVFIAFYVHLCTIYYIWGSKTITTPRGMLFRGQRQILTSNLEETLVPLWLFNPYLIIYEYVIIKMFNYYFMLDAGRISSWLIPSYQRTHVCVYKIMNS